MSPGNPLASARGGCQQLRKDKNTMDTRTILAKIITLIYKSRLLDSTDYDNLIKTVLETIKVDSPEFNFLGNNNMKNFKDTCLALLQEKDAIPKEVLIPQVSILLENDQKLLTVIKESIEPDHDESSNKRIVTNLVKTLNNYYREQLAIDILGKVSYDLKFNRNKISNFSEYLQNTISQLEPLSNSITSFKDPAVVNEVDFESHSSVETIFQEVKNVNSNNGIYKFGWHGINRLLQGGIRLGETLGIEALQHKGKTITSLSLFMHIALFNKPIMTKEDIDAKKKPLLLRISFEDSLTTNLQFCYEYLKGSDDTSVTKKDLDTITPNEMAAYAIPKLTANGFHIKMIRVDPSQWSYTNIFNKIIELEAQGYKLHVLMIDYLLMMPTTGCIQGALGADKRDLVRRVRNFCSARNIAFITPFQLSSEANQLLRNGVPDHQFVNEIAEKNYTDGCKTIGMELDAEILIHSFTHKRKKYIAFRRGKHRGLPDIPVDDKYCIYKFPALNIPILPDIHCDDLSLSRLPKDNDNGSTNLLEEVLS
jgi:hypothetical protein